MIVKKCKKCNTNKELIEYHKNKSSKDSHYSVCKICKRSKNNAYKALNKEAEKVRNSDWYQNNKEYKFQYYKEYYKNNKYRYNAACARRLKHIKKATLSGYKQEIDIIYKDKPNGYHVDHMVPLRGKTVCGLHVPWNLQYLTKEENLKKSNKLLEI